MVVAETGVEEVPFYKITKWTNMYTFSGNNHNMFRTGLIWTLCIFDFWAILSDFSCLILIRDLRNHESPVSKISSSASSECLLLFKIHKTNKKLVAYKANDWTLRSPLNLILHPRCDLIPTAVLWSFFKLLSMIIVCKYVWSGLWRQKKQWKNKALYNGCWIILLHKIIQCIATSKVLLVLTDDHYKHYALPKILIVPW